MKKRWNLDFDKLKVFYYVAKAEKFTTAAELLNVSQSALSRSIQLLEDRLCLKLFYRHPRGLTLTAQGKVLVPIIGRFLNEMETATEKLYEEEKKPKGPLRVIAAAGLLTHYILPYIPGFLKSYPDIRLTLISNDGIPSLEFGEAHIVIRPPIPSSEAEDLIQKHLLTNSVGLYASPQYLQEFGTPKHPEDLDHHHLIAFGNHPDAEGFKGMNWHLTLGTEPGVIREPFLQINSPQARLEMAQASLGIIALSKEHPGLDNSGLVQVLSDIPAPTVKSFFFYPKALENSKKVMVFQNYLEEAFIRDYGSPTQELKKGVK